MHSADVREYALDERFKQGNDIGIARKVGNCVTI